MLIQINIKLILTIFALILISYYIYINLYCNETYNDDDSICSELVIEDSSLEDCIKNFIKIQEDAISNN